MIAGLAEMRMVRYTLAPDDIDPIMAAKKLVPEGRSISAMIVKVVDDKSGTVNLTLFPDWSNDGFLNRKTGAIPSPVGIAWRENVPYSKEAAPGTWAFPDIPKAKRR